MSHIIIHYFIILVTTKIHYLMKGVGNSAKNISKIQKIKYPTFLPLWKKKQKLAS